MKDLSQTYLQILQFLRRGETDEDGLKSVLEVSPEIFKDASAIIEVVKKRYQMTSDQFLQSIKPDALEDMLASKYIADRLSCSEIESIRFAMNEALSKAINHTARTMHVHPDDVKSALTAAMNRPMTAEEFETARKAIDENYRRVD